MNINASINKSIPTNAPVILYYEDLVNNVQDQEKMLQILNKTFQNYNNFIRYQSQILFGLEFNMAIAIVTDFNTLQRRIEISEHAFYESIKRDLNLNLKMEKYNSDTEYRKALTEEALLKLKILKKLKTPADLQKKFPALYRGYLYYVKEYYTLKKNTIDPLTKLDPISRSYKIASLNKNIHESNPYFYDITILDLIKYVNSFNIKVYINDCITAINNILKYQDKIINYIHSNPIDFSTLSDDDTDTLEFYFAYCNLKQAKSVDSASKQNYLYYVSNYFKEHKDYMNSDISLVVGASDGKIMQRGTFSTVNYNISEGKVITPKILYEMYRDILIENPDLKVIDFSHFDFTGMNLDEVSQFMQGYLKDLQVNWELLPPDDKTFEKDIIEHITTSTKDLNTETKEQHQKKLLELFMAKKSLYDASNPIFRIKGKKTFDGYVGYVYPNGRVVLDKFYDKQTDSLLADGHAVYAMNIEEFYELSKLSKSELIKSKLCKRYIHKGDWAKKVIENEIKLKTAIFPTVKVRNLVKKDSPSNK